MTCPRCQAENRTGARFCHECGTNLGALCRRCGASTEPESTFCDACGAGLSAWQASREIPARFASPGHYTPKHLAERILTSRSVLEGERKQVTVLFADLKASMELLAERDPEQAREILDPVLELMMEAVHRYEGTVNQVLGDGIMALFGAPLAHEDHALRACYAALAMQEGVARYGAEVERRLGVPVQIRVGLNSGEVVVRTIGNDLRTDYSAIGETTHLAGRMEDLAPPGGIRLTASTVRLADVFVQVRSVGPLLIKGLRDPVEVFDLLGVRAVRRRVEAAVVRGLTQFIGRESELKDLQEALEEAGARHGQLVSVVGEPGVGKSRLLLEFSRSPLTRGWLLLETGTVSYGRATAYLPMLDLLKPYFRILEGDSPPTVRDKVMAALRGLNPALEEMAPPILALFGAVPEESPFPTFDPPRRRQLTHEALKGMLLAASVVQPVLLIVEDLQWVDSETQAFLDHLVDSIPTARVLLLLNYRPEYRHGWASKTYYTQIRLDPLSPEGAEALLEALLGHDGGLRPLKQLLIDRSEGNPFFVEEIVRALVETRVLVGEPGAYRAAAPVRSIQVPPTVQTVLAARIDRLPPEEKDLLQCASVIGKDVPFGLLRAIAGLPEKALRRSLGHLCAVEFLYERSLTHEVGYTFKHALTHEVAYNGLLHGRSRALHAKVVEAMEQLYGDRLADEAEALAHHAVRGEVWEKAVDSLRAAGARAFARGSIEETLDRYEQALSLTQRLPKSAPNSRRAIDVRLDLHVPLIVLGKISRLIELHQESERFARELNDLPRLGRLLYRMGHYSWMDGRYRDGIQYAQQALEIATVTDNPEVRCLATYALGLNHCSLGSYREAVDLFTRVVEGPDAELAARLLAVTVPAYIVGCGWLAYSATRIGDLDRALTYSERAVRRADLSDHPQAQAIAYTLRAMPLVYRGETGEAVDLCERALHLCETRVLLVWLPAASATLGWALASAGRVAEGLPYLERGATILETIGVKAHLSRLYVWWAEGLLLAGNLDEAQRVTDRAVQLAAGYSEHGDEAEGLYIAGRIAAARDQGDIDSAGAAYERARAIASQLGMRPLLARCHLGLGQLHRRGGQPVAEHLAAAAALFRETGMRRWLEEAETALSDKK